MTITSTTLTRAAGLSAAVGGLLYIAVQIGHPHLDLSVVTTTEYKIRQTMKVLFASLSLAGITGMYLRQIQRTGILGLLGYLLFGAGFLIMTGLELTGAVVLPAIVSSSPGYVSDVLAVATGGTATSDIGLFPLVNNLVGVGYVAGGLLFGIALFRAKVLARWAAALLAVSTVATLTIPLLPQLNQRLFAIPTGVALVGLGYSLWREQRTPATSPVRNQVSPHLDPAGAK